VAPENRSAIALRARLSGPNIESLRDGREVYIDGERVADATAHPAFRNSARSLARLYGEHPPGTDRRPA
jgi:4-hydroxyphenylacetate 3-monooxygenase